MTVRLKGKFVLTLPPRTPLLKVMFWAGKLFPRKDRSPQMVPQNVGDVIKAGVDGRLVEIDRVSTGFYKSTALVFEGVLRDL